MAAGKSPPAAGARIDLRVIPRAAHDGIDGERDGRVVVRVTAPPVDRAANDAVIALLASRLGLPRRAIRIVTGEASRNKTVRIDGIDAAAVRARLLA
jgi:uncharacterized protein (TIGR00251 family)